MNLTAWDPSKWYIWLLARTGLAWGLRRARDEDIAWAVRMQKKRDVAKAAGLDPDELLDSERHEEDRLALSLGSINDSSDEDAVWNYDMTLKYACAVPGRCLMVIDGFVVEATKLLGEHVRELASFQHTCYQLTTLTSPGAQCLSGTTQFAPPTALRQLTRSHRRTVRRPWETGVRLGGHTMVALITILELRDAA